MAKLLTVICLLCALVGMSLGFVQDTKIKKTTKEELAKATAYYAKVKKAYEKNPKDAKAKETFTKTGNRYAKMIMDADFLTPKEMYPRALHVYRDVKKADPKNKEANDWIKTIEGIYKSMGRKIPPE